jgi:hypothetical protein
VAVSRERGGEDDGCFFGNGSWGRGWWGRVLHHRGQRRRGRGRGQGGRMGGSSSRGREQFAVRGREEQFAAQGVRDAGRKEEDARSGGHHGRDLREE